MDHHCLSQNVSIPLPYNICVFCKYYYFPLRKLGLTYVGSRSNMKLTNFIINNLDPSKILKVFELEVHQIPLKILRMFELEIHLMRWHYNNSNFCRIWSNDDSIPSQENRLYEYYHLSYIFLLNFATMNGQTCKNMKKIRIFHVSLIKSQSILIRSVDI